MGAGTARHQCTSARDLDQWYRGGIPGSSSSQSLNAFLLPARRCQRLPKRALASARRQHHVWLHRPHHTRLPPRWRGIPRAVGLCAFSTCIGGPIQRGLQHHNNGHRPNGALLRALFLASALRFSWMDNPNDRQLFAKGVGVEPLSPRSHHDSLGHRASSRAKAQPRRHPCGEFQQGTTPP